MLSKPASSEILPPTRLYLLKVLLTSNSVNYVSLLGRFLIQTTTISKLGWKRCSKDFPFGLRSGSMPLQGNMGTWRHDSHRMDSGIWEGSCLLASVVRSLSNQRQTDLPMGYLATTPQKMELILFLDTINERKQGTGNISKNSAWYLLVFELRSVFSHIDQEACTPSIPVWCPAISNVCAVLQTGEPRAAVGAGCWWLAGLGALGDEALERFLSLGSLERVLLASLLS